MLHIPAQGIGVLSTVASGAGKLPVRRAENGLPIENGHVYLAPADGHLLLADGHTMLGSGPPENMFRPAIDPLFRSAALHYGPRVIGVALSGLLSDGAAGLNAIKRCGGLAVAQDPAEAIADQMPRRALEATTVDPCVPADRLGDLLSDLVREKPGRALSISPARNQARGRDRLGRTHRRRQPDRHRKPGRADLPELRGVLSELKIQCPLRFRCQVGHAFTADVLASRQDGRIDEALRIALRIIEERADLVHRMAEDGRHSGRLAVARIYDAKAAEYREYGDTLRRAMLQSLVPKPTDA